jgi:hypothetical protein
MLELLDNKTRAWAQLKAAPVVMMGMLVIPWSCRCLHVIRRCLEFSTALQSMILVVIDIVELFL